MAKLRDRIQLAIQKRVKQPSRISSLPVRLKATSGEQNRSTHLYATTLLAVESRFVTMWRLNPSIDDEHIAAALKLAILQHEATSPKVHDLLIQIAAVRSASSPAMDDDSWRDCLRTIYLSVTTRSTCKPGVYSYLEFARQFVTQVQ